MTWRQICSTTAHIPKRGRKCCVLVAASWGGRCGWRALVRTRLIERCPLGYERLLTVVKPALLCAAPRHVRLDSLQLREHNRPLLGLGDFAARAARDQVCKGLAGRRVGDSHQLFERGVGLLGHARQRPRELVEREDAVAVGVKSGDDLINLRRRQERCPPGHWPRQDGLELV